MTAPRKVLVDVADLEALRTWHRVPAMCRDSVARLVAAIPEPEYASYPGHPLADVPQPILDIARAVLDGAAVVKDVSDDMAHPIADAVVSALHEAGHLTIEPEPEPLPPTFVPLLDDDGMPVVRAPKAGEWCLDGWTVRYVSVHDMEPRTIYTKVETER